MQCTTTSTTQLLSDKVDSVVAAYPTYPYQAAFQNTAIKQLLLDYLEHQLKQAMPRLNHPQEWQRLPQYLNQLIELELRLESYVYWGIEYIIHEQLDMLTGSPDKLTELPCSVQDMTQTCMPSYWFG